MIATSYLFESFEEVMRDVRMAKQAEQNWKDQNRKAREVADRHSGRSKSAHHRTSPASVGKGFDHVRAYGGPPENHGLSMLDAKYRW